MKKLLLSLFISLLQAEKECIKDLNILYDKEMDERAELLFRKIEASTKNHETFKISKIPTILNNAQFIRNRLRNKLLENESSHWVFLTDREDELISMLQNETRVTVGDFRNSSQFRAPAGNFLEEDMQNFAMNVVSLLLQNCPGSFITHKAVSSTTVTEPPLTSTTTLACACNHECTADGSCNCFDGFELNKDLNLCYKSDVPKPILMVLETGITSASISINLERNIEEHVDEITTVTSLDLQPRSIKVNSSETIYEIFDIRPGSTFTLTAILSDSNGIDLSNATLTIDMPAPSISMDISDITETSAKLAFTTSVPDAVSGGKIFKLSNVLDKKDSFEIALEEGQRALSLNRATYGLTPLSPYDVVIEEKIGDFVVTFNSSFTTLNATILVVEQTASFDSVQIRWKGFKNETTIKISDKYGFNKEVVSMTNEEVISDLIPENEYKIELFQTIKSFTASTNKPVFIKTDPIMFTAAVENITAFGGEINFQRAFLNDFRFESVFKNLLLNISRDDDGVSTTTRFYKIDDVDKLFVLEDLLPESKYHLNIRGTLIKGNRPHKLSTIIFNTSPPDPKFFPTISSDTIIIKFQDIQISGAYIESSTTKMMVARPELYRTLSLTLDFTKNEIIANNLQPGIEYVITLQQKERNEVKLTYITEAVDTTTTTSTTTFSTTTKTELTEKEPKKEYEVIVKTTNGFSHTTTTAKSETTAEVQKLTTMHILEDFISETRVQANTILKETEQLDFIEVEKSQTDEELCNSEDRSFFEFCEELLQSKLHTTTEEMSRTARTLPIGYLPGKVELGKVQSLADVSSLGYLNEGSGENDENSAIILITENDKPTADLTETKLITKYSSTTIETTTKKKQGAKSRTASRKNDRKGHRQHEFTTKSPTTTSPSVEAESEFSLILTSFDSQESSIVDSENNIIEPSVVPVNMEVHGPDQSMNINEIKRENEMMSIITASVAGVGGLLLVVFFALILVHRIRKSDQGSYFIPWESAKTSGALAFIDDSRTSTVTGEELPDAINSLTPFLNRKGLDFSNPETVTVKNFDGI